MNHAQRRRTAGTRTQRKTRFYPFSYALMWKDQEAPYQLRGITKQGSQSFLGWGREGAYTLSSLPHKRKPPTKEGR